jgi:hypothetical protein
MTKSPFGSIHVTRIVARKGSKAALRARRRSRLMPAALAPGFPATPAHDLIFNGGRTIPDLQFFNYFVGGQDAWNATDVTNINAALGAAMSDQNLNNVVQQYFHGPITSKLLGSDFLAGPPPAVVSQGDVEDLVTRLSTSGKFDSGTDFTSTVFNFMLPSGTILNDNPGVTSSQLSAHLESEKKSRELGAIPGADEGDSTNGLGGYHGSIHAGNMQLIYYAVGVFSEVRPDGTTNGIPAFDTPWKNVVATFYHELNEARTDPDVEEANRTGSISVVGWTSSQGEEIGDFPVFEADPLSQVFQEVPLTDGSGTVPVQFLYSNAAHGPEGPIPQPH